jgi:hypothetical protein
MSTKTKIIKSVAPKQLISQNQKIPRIIWQTFKTDTVPQEMYRAAMSWLEYNPEYEYRFFEDENCISFIKEHFDAKVLEAYYRIEPGAFRADLWRYCALYIYGGVYADIDTVCQSPLSKLIQEDDEFISPCATTSDYAIFNAFICTIPQHPFLKRTIERAADLILSNNPTKMFLIVGPSGLGISTNLELGRDEEHSFKPGKYQINNFNFHILDRIHTKEVKERKVINGDLTVFLPKYQEYLDNLEALGVPHWHRGSNYNQNLFTGLGKNLFKKLPRMFSK